MTLIGPAGLATTATDPGSVVTLSDALLQAASGEHAVMLPHALSREDFAPEGEVVRFSVAVNITDPAVDRAIYILKMSRSGRVWLNGHDLGTCGARALEQLRCLHQPQLFRPLPQYWRAGINQIEVQVFASGRQTNGLSQIVVGPTDALHTGPYQASFMLRVASIDALGWLTLSLGLLSLLIFFTQPAERLYGWYGLTCMFGFLSNMNILVAAPTIPLAAFDWLVFSTRIVFTCLLGVTYLSFYRKDRPVYVRFLVAYAAVATVVVWAVDSDPRSVSLLYMPLQGIALLLSAASLRWSWLSNRRGDWLMASSFLIMPVAGFLDLARLLGGASFTGTYVLVYTSAVTLALMGIGILGMLTYALRTTRNLSVTLQRRVEQREEELRKSYRNLIDAEQKRARSEERSRMLQDMHDGFLSTLSLTRLALSSARTTTQDAAAYVGECIDDLRLMLEASANDTGSLEDTMVDFIHRYRVRLTAAGIDSSLDLQLDGMPALPAGHLLQIMRIVQEAMSNGIRHSKARSLAISARWDAEAGRVSLKVQDDGRGLPATGLREGRGMKHMRNRARALGGSLEIDTGPAGSCVVLTVPLTAAAPAGERSRTIGPAAERPEAHGAEQ